MKYSYPETENTNYQDYSISGRIDISANQYYSDEFDKLEKENNNLKRSSYYYLEWTKFQQDIAYILMIMYYILWVVAVIMLISYKQTSIYNFLILMIMLLYPYLVYHYLMDYVLYIIDILLDYLPNDSLLYSDVN
tara:strand:- start:983 stop:1387 length:405 start_codon:yes stop_codon:yes gene_type:complete